MKFEVVFPGLRDADRLATYQRLWGVSNDITRACNQAISALWLVTLGQLSRPTRTLADGNVKDVPLRTLAYQAFSGAWQPYGYPLYTPYEGKGRCNPAAAGGVLSETAAAVLTRLKTDANDIRSGKKSLATFREMPICYRASEVTLRPDGAIELVTFAGRKNNRVTIRPRKLDASQRALLARCAEGQLKYGSARLQWKQRPGTKGKWLFSLTWTDPNHAVQPASLSAPALVAGVDLGIEHAIWVAYTDEAGQPRRYNDVIEFPAAVLHATAKRRKAQRERLRWNRKDVGLRTGRGRDRKLRVVAHIGDVVTRTHTTMVRQLAAAAVEKARARGASLLVLEDHKDWSVHRMHAEADDRSRSEAARLRATYFRWHQGAMRAALEQYAEKVGLQCIAVDAAWSSRVCSQCGTNHKDTGVYRRGPKPDGPEFGRISLRHFVCSCGADLHADRNAAINLARRGLAAVRKENEGAEEGAAK